MRRKLLTFLTSFVILLGIVFPTMQKAFAINEGGCAGATVSPGSIKRSQKPIQVIITSSGNCFSGPGGSYMIELFHENDSIRLEPPINVPAVSEKSIAFDFPGNVAPGLWVIKIGTGLGGKEYIRTTITLTDLVKPTLRLSNPSDLPYRPGETATLIAGNLTPDTEYSIKWNEYKEDTDPNAYLNENNNLKWDEASNNNERAVSFTIPEDILKPYDELQHDVPFCIFVAGVPNSQSCLNITITKYPTINYDKQATCQVTLGETITFTASDLLPNQEYDWDFAGNNKALDANLRKDRDIIRTDKNSPTATFQVPTSVIKDGERVCVIFDGSPLVDKGFNCINFNVTQTDKGNLSCSENNDNIVPSATPVPPYPPCAEGKISTIPSNDDENSQAFIGCDELHTGLGIDISTNPINFINDLFRFLLSISGGILLALIVYSGYQMMTSQGNADKIKEARERILSAVVGFVFLIFSLVILEIIGVDILRLPCFGDNECKNAPKTGNPSSEDKIIGPKVNEMNTNSNIDEAPIVGPKVEEQNTSDAPIIGPKLEESTIVNP